MRGTIISTPDRQEEYQDAAALARIQYHDDWPRVRAWLERRLERLRDQNDDTHEDTSLRWGQGRAQEIKDILRELDKAEDVAKALASGQADGPL